MWVPDVVTCGWGFDWDCGCGIVNGAPKPPSLSSWILRNLEQLLFKGEMNTRDFRTIMFYEFKLRHNAAQATANINSAFGHGTVSERNVRRWFERFRKGDASLEYQGGRGPRNVLDDEVLRDAVEGNRESSVRALAAELGASKSTVGRHLGQMDMVKKMPKWILHQVTADQQMNRLNICLNLI
ncbi:hypothetical protein ANCDUO_07569, partial [Ancylostoma duodenale]